jgi:hypothetical protein
MKQAAEHFKRTVMVWRQWVYFIQSGRGGALKIGVAVDVNKRLETLRVGNPADLIVRGAIRGGYAEEKHLHRLFGKLRMRGEWFGRAETILEYVEQNYDFHRP